jgi:endonuclease YncB( thermonuclease family)
MKKNFLNICALFFFLLLFPTITPAWQGHVTSITDGDTLKVLDPEKREITVHLYGIDAPEKNQPYGLQAEEFLAAQLQNRIIDIEETAGEQQHKAVAIIMHSGSNVNEMLIRSGYAWVDRKGCSGDFCATWINYEEQAKANRLGLWKEQEPVAPWKWRKEKSNIVFKFLLWLRNIVVP